ncbi:hypothetical protein PsYK624_101790 [Phanerochaete sordida]|uniref:DUF6534 domain-containing protein n=1 Tax=Phanerochaete sordida TaxID=48140 RepID=A0A9P3GFK1_9APHY|nr:hypothetical protein PsYK624_101790 [Phanerochaete sordida]
MGFDNTLGAVLVAEVFSGMSYSVASMQTYTYYHRSPHDGAVMKFTIFALWILDGLHFAFYSHATYHFTVTSVMSPGSLTSCPWSLALDLATGDLIEIIVSLIFAYRIYRFSSTLWPLIFIIAPSAASFVGAVAITALALKTPNFADFHEKYSWAWYATFSLQAFTDCAITAVLSTLLLIRRTGIKRTDSLIRTLIIYSVNTCALTSSLAVASIITYATMPHNFIFFAIATVVPKLLLNSLLALLNSRDMLRDMHAGQVVSIHISALGSMLVPRSISKAPGVQATRVHSGGVGYPQRVAAPTPDISQGAWERPEDDMA